MSLALRPAYDPERRVSRATPLAERLATAIEAMPSGCWEWRRARHEQGYGLVRVRGKTRRAHRVVYELLIGPVPEGLVLDHVVCDNPPCCNPAHLKPATHAANILRGGGLAADEVTRTHCPQGHPYDAENTYVLPSRPNARYCKECNRQRRRERRAREGR